MALPVRVVVVSDRRLLVTCQAPPRVEPRPDSEDATLNDLAKNIVLWIVIAVVVATVVSNFSARSGAVQEIPYSTFLEQVKDGGVAEVTLNKTTDVIRGVRTNGEQFIVYNPETDNTALIGTLQKHNVKFSGAAPERQSFLMQLFISSFPILLLIARVGLLHAPDAGRRGRPRRHVVRQEPGAAAGRGPGQVTFADVAGVDEAKEEVGEIVEFLKDPGKFQKLGGKIPARRADGRLARAPARRCWPAPSPAKPRCRSSRFPVPTSSRCSSASAPRACATCSSRRRSMRRASSSSTRSTRSAAIAAPASAAVTTSASRR